MNRHLYRIFLIFITFIFLSCSKKKSSKKTFTHRFFALGTLCEIKIDKENIDDAISYISALESIFSISNSNSEISNINKNAGLFPTKVSSDAIYVLKKAKELYYKTYGNFNVLVGCYTRLYRDETLSFCKEPKQEELSTLTSKNLTDIEDLVINEEKMEVFLKKKEEYLDLGGIAKGYIVDKTSQFLEKKGFSEYIINFGGDVLVRGNRDFNIGIQDPQSKDTYAYNSPIMIEKVRNSSLVTSGAYQRNFISSSGKFLHHIIDPKTGQPCQIQAKSVSVIYQDTLIADALSTAIFIDNSLKQGIQEQFNGCKVILI